MVVLAANWIPGYVRSIAHDFPRLLVPVSTSLTGRRPLCAVTTAPNSTSLPFIDTARIIHPFGTCGEHEGVGCAQPCERPGLTGPVVDRMLFRRNFEEVLPL